jgi:ABC-type nickel/cobalt efflux system permease component RcnA
VVRVEASARTTLRVVANYRLDVDEFTVVYEDLPALVDRAALRELRKPADFYEAFLKYYAPVLASNLRAQLDGQELQFTCIKKSYTQKDEHGIPLGHLRAEFVFEAKVQLVWPLVTRCASFMPGPTSSVNLLLAGLADQNALTIGSKGFRLVDCHRLVFKEGNYELEEGSIRLSLSVASPLGLLARSEPDEALKARPLPDLKPGDDERLRQAWVEFVVNGSPDKHFSASIISSNQTDPGQERDDAPAFPATGPSDSAHSSLALLLDSERGFLVLLALAAGFGAAHALTPGHGKTLVAAYLVGERGTAFHALFLGLVTTLTHTGAVLALAALLLLVFPRTVPRDVQFVLGLVGGLLVAGMGFWLLLRRLTGGADHFHLPGHSHDHGHRHLGHYHDEHGHAHRRGAASETAGWWGLLVLGISGGIVPCWDAILMLGFALSAQRLWLGVPLLLAFSAGLAAVLIAVGLAVVYVKGFASSRWGDKGLVRGLPVISAVLVTAMGLWLCYSTAHMPRG